MKNATLNKPLSRRAFLRTSALVGGTFSALPILVSAAERRDGSASQPPPTQGLRISDLPVGSAPAPVSLPHFSDPLHAFVWRNWQLVPVARLAKVVGASPRDIMKLGHAMGLTGPSRIPANQWRRSYLTILKRNWHLLPYEQLLDLLDWTPEQMAFTLREDDFLFVKLGNLKPRCAPVRYAPPNRETQEHEKRIADLMRREFRTPVDHLAEPLFQFVSDLSARPASSRAAPPAGRPSLSPRFCSSYFALYGDPLLEPEADPYPDGYLARLAASGVDGVWLQGVLSKLAPFPWSTNLSERREERIRSLRALVARARRHGIGVYLYLNEPRSMPLAFYQAHPELKGVVEGDHATLCTSHPEVQNYLTESVASICRQVPDLAGFFTITASENLTNCWSHGGGSKCPRCAQRPPAEVIAEVNGLFDEGIRRAGSPTRLIAWDWGWADAWAGDAIAKLPSRVALMSVSEWSIPIQRGGVSTTVGEYSISVIGPGPRAQRHWGLARQRNLKTLAKIQAGNTWELSAVPYIPAVENVARHAARLRKAQIDGLMLGWTLGGYPSPNLEVVAEIAGAGETAPGSAGIGEDTERSVAENAMQRVARRRFGAALGPEVVQAWRAFSAAFREFPYHGGLVYSAPLQLGPANLLWAEPTGYRATMVGFPYDDLEAWRAVYPAEIFVAQLKRVASGFDQALEELQGALRSLEKSLRPAERRNAAGELQVAEAAAIHFRSVANQGRFVLDRRALASAKTAAAARALIEKLEQVLGEELGLAQRLHALQSRDSRIGFEASNQYYYVPIDLAEKVLNCRDLLDRWLPTERSKWGG